MEPDKCIETMTTLPSNQSLLKEKKLYSREEGDDDGIHQRLVPHLPGLFSLWDHIDAKLTPKILVNPHR